MGLRVRKSINLGGGFRINLSSSGVGYSWGVPGYRVSRTARGTTRRTTSIPGTGISYVDESGNRQRSAGGQTQNTHEYAIYTEMTEIESGSIENFRPTEYIELIKKMQLIIRLNKISTWLIVCIVLYANPLFFVIGIIGIAMKVYIRSKGKIELDYQFDTETQNEYAQKIAAWKSLNSCNKLWQIIESAQVTNTKTSGGATSAIKRLPLKITTKAPWFLKSNIEVIILALKKETLIILPDKLLLIKGNKIGAINYNNINYNIYATGFLEDERPPKDSEFVKKVWQKTNKDGSPDKRFKGNKQIPVYKYGRIDLSSPEGLNSKIMCSNERIAEQFRDKILNQ